MTLCPRRSSGGFLIIPNPPDKSNRLCPACAKTDGPLPASTYLLLYNGFMSPACPCDPSSALTSFQERVWKICAIVPSGRVTTYGAIARALNTRAYRAVGQAIHRNPFAPIVPCHRVVGADGALTGFAAGLARKRQLLRAEGVTFRGRRVDLARHFFDPACPQP